MTILRLKNAWKSWKTVSVSKSVKSFWYSPCLLRPRAPTGLENVSKIKTDGFSPSGRSYTSFEIGLLGLLSSRNSVFARRLGHSCTVSCSPLLLQALCLNTDVSAGTTIEKAAVVASAASPAGFGRRDQAGCYGAASSEGFASRLKCFHRFGPSGAKSSFLF